MSICVNFCVLNTGTNTLIDRLGQDYGPVEITPSVSTSIFVTDSAWVQKKNGIVTVYVYGKALTKDVFIFATLPVGLRPYLSISGNGPIIYNDDGNITSSGTVKDNGKIQLSALPDKHISFSISYPAYC